MYGYRQIMACLGVLFLLFTVSSANAGIRLNKTRIIFNEGVKSAGAKFINTGKDNYLVEATILDASTGRPSDDFMVIPPVFRSQGGRDNVLKIIMKRNVAISDRESDYKLLLNAIPASKNPGTDANSGRVSFSLGFSVKMFYRPTGLRSDPSEVSKMLSFFRDKEGRISAKNDSEYNISFSELSLGNEQVNLNQVPSMVRPFTTIHFKTHKQADMVTWRYIDDFGGESKVIKSGIK